MNIVIDARMVNRKMHGIARHTYNLIENLPKIDQKNRYTVLVGEEFPGIAPNSPNIKMRHVKSRWISLSEQWELIRVLKELKPDLYHTPSFVAPVLNPFPMIMTIHDATHMVFSNDYSVLHVLYYRFVVKPSARKSVKILTGSEFSKKHVSRYLSIPEGKIEVINSGCSEKFRPIKDEKELERVRRRYSLPEHFILYVGAYKPHKNVFTLLKAYKGLSLQIPLCLSGDGTEELLALSERLGIEKMIKFAGHIEDDDLPAVYNCAALFVFPSLYEGFGLPPLEAMACGCPVVVSNVASLPEVCGDAAYYVNPYDAQSVADGICSVVGDHDLRHSLIQKGLQRARLFSWEKSAKEHITVYEEVLDT